MVPSVPRALAGLVWTGRLAKGLGGAWHSLGKMRKITEITTEKVVAEDADRFVWKLPKHATAVFLLEGK